ncbi:hypothetical protein L202_04750 [Cryptococcus amylolentus CBS 6039]|uniref:Ribosomal RNA-processing protein 8 n=2 Tax=Cryptococcus amylolentus TaxID=104669 RepID=A0A1E3HMK8_9TREE|nr:hypothetical protein L202_04750 [Cryptococcus amylolentus CBS 6039]ODN77582.1 hypothetical protein L202_04750 [Cryptococcus amylolentus CBS 6039]ODO05617.1 hypothetical protein I350_04676 [Cryptococcus amylolentus CBS 6273]
MSLFPSKFDTSFSGPTHAFLAAAKSGGKNAPKRKRESTGNTNTPGGKGQDAAVKQADANFEKLLKKFGEEAVVKEKGEGKEGMGQLPGQGKKKKQRQEKVAEQSPAPSPAFKAGKGRKSVSAFDDEPAPSPAKSQKKNKGDTPQGKKSKATPTTKAAKVDPVELPIPSIPNAGTKLQVGGEGMSDMQQKMQDKLGGARFRWINEQLYSTPSTEAVAMMKKDPKIFADYHQSHRLQTAAWPSPPLPHLVSLLSPLRAGAIIADLGCGDAGLARELVPKGKVVLSYDLVGDSGWVVEADFLTHVPLPGRPGVAKKNPAASEVVDAVVCCLSLMGVNWVGGIYEACRILKQGGEFHIAEVTSRFVDIPAFNELVISFGFSLEGESQPSTHFTLFKFVKEAEVPQGPARGEKGWDARVKEGEGILKGCVYKKR